MKFQRSRVLAASCALGLALGLGGCKSAGRVASDSVDAGKAAAKQGAEAAGDAAQKGSEAAGEMMDKGADAAKAAGDEAKEMADKAAEAGAQAGDEAKQMAEKAAEASADAVAGGLEMATEAFQSGKEVTEDTAQATEARFSEAVDTMEAEFNEMKSEVDPPKVEEISAKFASLKNDIAALGDKTGAELVEGLNKVKTEGSELAAELNALKDQVVGEKPQPEGEAAAE